ncbi:hypothetical protein ACEPAG_3118 [Sanghuangporus baumii]
MTHTSPTTFAVWSVLSFSLGAFLLGHLWRFDKFKCLKWSNSPYSGAFKRIMTYTYLITIPLIMIYSFGFTFIKYKEGFIDVGGTIMPKPYTFWSKGYRHAIFPLMMVFSFAWSFEMVTHLEELCFWYFLITAGPAQPDWFHSPYFRIWILGSIAAVVYVPAVTIAYRDNPLSCEARMYTSGSVGDLILTLAFIPILFRFPGFIRKVKAEGVDSAIIVRLRKFYELNVIRIIFRFLMQIPLLSLGVDGLKPHDHELNESLFWTDLFSIIAALGCVFSSVCTLLLRKIFFPRSYEAEYHAKELSHRRSMHSMSSRQSHEPQPAYSQYGDDDRHEFEPESIGKSASFNTHKFSGNDHYEDDYVKFERTERRMGTGLVRERLSSKLREPPAYSPPQDPLIPMQIQEQNVKQKDNKRAGIGANVATRLRTHPFASASAPLDLQAVTSASRPAYMREQSDAPPVTVALQSDTLQTTSGRHGVNHTSPHSRLTTANTTDHSYGTDLERNVGPLPGGRVLGLTAANLSRLNSSTRASQVNPLVRTFTSPIDFLDRIQESGGSGPDSRGAAANASRTQTGWAV